MSASAAASRSPLRRKLLVAGVVLAVLAAYGWAWQVLNVRAQHMDEMVSGLYRDVAWMHAAAERVHSLRVQAEAAGAMPGSFAEFLEQVRRDGTMAGTVTEARSGPPGEARISIEAASLDDLVLWLVTLESRYAVRVTGLSLERDAREGLARVHLTLEQQ